MNKLIILSFLFFICIDLNAQSPFGLNYQAVARNPATGIEIANDDLYVQFQLRQGSINGQEVYAEIHQTTTNEFGLFNLIIGQGISTGNDFSSINWGSDNFFLATLIDDGSGFEEIGVVQLLSVPYALHANTVSNTDDADADPNNENNLAIDFDDDSQSLSITDLAGTLSADLSTLADEDGDPTNEQITDVLIEGTALKIIESGIEHNVELADLLPQSHWDSNGPYIHSMDAQGVGIGVDNESPSSTLDINGSISYETNIVDQTSFAPSTNGSHYLVKNNGPVSITLPSSSNCTGRKYVFIMQNSVTHEIAFNTADASLIDSGTNKLFPSNHGEQVFSVISFGEEGWFFIQGL